MTSRTEISSRLLSVFQDVFDDDTIVLDDSTTASDIEGWDSLAHIGLVIAIEREFSIRMAAKEVGDLKNVGQMIGLIENRTAG
jgi:acyl carrier protein